MSKEIDDPRRKILIGALSLGLFAIPNLAGLTQPAHALGTVSRRLPEGRSIYKLKGQVTVDGIPADLQTQIGPNALIKTGPNSRVIFAVGNDAFLLRSNSELKMGSSGGLLVEGMRMLSGRILSVFGERKEPHTITTTTATIGIRGTGIYVESEPDRSYVCTCYGHTRIISNVDPDTSRDIVTKYHDKPLYILQGGSNLIVSAPVINHTDAELALIESLVGRRTPFPSSSGFKMPGTGGGESGY